MLIQNITLVSQQETDKSRRPSDNIMQRIRLQTPCTQQSPDLLLYTYGTLQMAGTLCAVFVQTTAIEHGNRCSSAVIVQQEVCHRHFSSKGSGAGGIVRDTLQDTSNYTRPSTSLIICSNNVDDEQVFLFPCTILKFKKSTQLFSLQLTNFTTIFGAMILLFILIICLWLYSIASFTTPIY